MPLAIKNISVYF